MNEEYKEKLLRRYEYLNTTTQELERTIDLIKDSATLDHDTIAKSVVFLEGFKTGLKKEIDWLNCIMP